ncbi:conserved membrane protein [Synechococcus sp. BIOS-E4-1]|uniref:hypothetical protein n=1 Tax=Synechococcus sp. BIOS-E4-1 TaxID=1400864 RepID=UPI001644C5A2|nr:hypothetical protein [Synechococcus sp. BIOS-E4-1]QNI53201.1 conserved membrane protein [Synechococcus sp. BIOS-E4-1]
MLWLIALVLLLQALFHWTLEPAIRWLTPLFELRVLPLLLGLLGIWFLAGRTDSDRTR